MTDLALDQLRTLAAVVGEGSFEAAAASLHVTPSAVSQRIKALEAATGRVLVRRTRPVAVTEQGSAVLRAARQVDLLLADLVPSVAHPGPVTIPVVVNADSLATWFVPSIAVVADQVCVDVHREDEQHSLGRLRDGTVLAAVAADPGRVPGCTVTSLGTMRYRAMATPGFVARWFADGVSAAALATAPVVQFDRLDDLQHRFVRRVTRRRVDPPHHYVPGSEAYRDAIRLGLGWGMLPDLQSAALEQTGAVREIGERTRIDVRLFWHLAQLESRPLALLSDAVHAGARRHLS
ncbi:LysR family transcriptional regulator ArgP [Mumia sp. zg.B17]|uniref:LysR family transcriptional regulator ArgP n=1 Tax=Mumia sp. zg.B17 TaxID=2855446 RepID=UPI001C6E5140|nr:LysR family transcriptional regulator ArgP [Mumia sp. zg.B17]MBW9206507.1 LysR family transcriptional regulator ArgP [Mumia sp. zg.B17]